MRPLIISTVGKVGALARVCVCMRICENARIGALTERTDILPPFGFAWLYGLEKAQKKASAWLASSAYCALFASRKALTASYSASDISKVYCLMPSLRLVV